jgi:glutaredoxin
MADDDSQTASSGLASATPARIRVLLALLLAAIFNLLQIKSATTPQDAVSLAWERDGQLHVFFQADCPHCHRAIEFLKTQPGIAIDLHNVATAAGRNLLGHVASELGIGESNLGVPFVFGRRYLIGFDAPETTGRELIALIAGKAESAPSDKVPLFSCQSSARSTPLSTRSSG